MIAHSSKAKAHDAGPMHESKALDALASSEGWGRLYHHVAAVVLEWKAPANSRFTSSIHNKKDDKVARGSAAGPCTNGEHHADDAFLEVQNTSRSPPPPPSTSELWREPHSFGFKPESLQHACAIIETCPEAGPFVLAD